MIVNTEILFSGKHLNVTRSSIKTKDSLAVSISKTFKNSQ